MCLLPQLELRRRHPYLTGRVLGFAVALLALTIVALAAEAISQ